MGNPDDDHVHSIGAGAPPSGSWPLYIKDDTDRPGDFGYHNAPTGNQPASGFVFARTAGGYWTVTLSHELIELRMDPAVAVMTIAGSNIVYPSGNINPAAAYAVAREPCDPVESTTYLVGNTPVADFVFPSWFNAGGAAPFDQLGQVTHPFQVLAGGSLP